MWGLVLLLLGILGPLILAALNWATSGRFHWSVDREGLGLSLFLIGVALPFALSHLLKDLVDFEGIEIYWPDARRMLTAEGYRRFKDARIILLVAVLFGLAVVLCRGLVVPGLSPAETRYLRGVWAIASLVLMGWGAFSARDWLSMRGGLVSSMVVITLVCCVVVVMTCL